MKFSSFRGENNRLKDFALDVVEQSGRRARYLSASQNVILDNTGRIESRDGFTSVLSAGTGRGLFYAAGKMLFADGTSLKRVSFGPYSASTVATVDAGRIAYAESNGEIFFSDGLNIQCLEAGDTVRAVGIPVAASLSGTSISGSLHPAWYQVTITYFYGDEEGGAYPSINVNSSGGIRLTIPASPAGVTGIGVYLSGPNGEVPTLHSIVAPSTSTLDLTTEPAGRTLMTQFKGAMPAGELLAFHDGRLLSAVGNGLYYSDPYNYGMTTPAKNYILFPAEVTVVQPLGSGVFVVADKTYFLTGIGTDEMSLNKPLLPYGAVKFAAIKSPREEVVFWLSERGLVIASGDGQVKNLQEDSLLLNLGGTGAALYVEGNDRVIAHNG